jgi:glycerol dehydrogenase-like iron-containing ADH family enzyme
LPPTNIARVDYGKGSAENVARDYDSSLAVSMEVPWAQARERLGKPPRQVHLVKSVDFDAAEALVESAPAVEAVIGIGGGQAVDVAKYVAWRRGMRLALIPTIISTDAFATPAPGLRRGGNVAYLGEARAERLVIDYNLIKTAPARTHAGGQSSMRGRSARISSRQSRDNSAGKLRALGSNHTPSAHRITGRN